MSNTSLMISQLSGGTLGERSRIARVAQRKNLDEVAHAVGVHATTVSRWERDRAMPSPADLATLARCLRVTVAWLLTGEV